MSLLFSKHLSKYLWVCLSRGLDITGRREIGPQLLGSDKSLVSGSGTTLTFFTQFERRSALCMNCTHKSAIQQYSWSRPVCIQIVENTYHTQSFVCVRASFGQELLVILAFAMSFSVSIFFFFNIRQCYTFANSALILQIQNLAIIKIKPLQYQLISTLC